MYQHWYLKETQWRLNILIVLNTRSNNVIPFFFSDWEKYVGENIKEWKELYTCWMRSCPAERLLIVHFEKLQRNTEEELIRILNFLGVPVHPQRIKCLLRHIEGYFYRKFHIQLDNPYPRNVFQIIFDSMLQFNRTLVKFKNESLPVNLYPLFNKLSSDGSWQWRMIL